MYVSEVDHRRALALVGDVAQATSPAEFVAVLLPGLRRTIGADEVTYSEIVGRHPRIGPTYGFPTSPQAAPDAARMWFTRPSDHPWVRFALSRHRLDAVRLSELCPRPTLQRSPFYQDFYRRRGVEYADYATIAAVDGTLVGIGLNRAARDFSDAEHDVVEHLRRPLGGMWAAARRTSALRSAVPVDHAWPVDVTTQLSPAERRVMDLVGRGCSNREAAAVLGVSVKSVEQHLTRIYRLLGVRSRSQLVRLIVTAGYSSGEGGPAAGTT